MNSNNNNNNWWWWSYFALAFWLLPIVSLAIIPQPKHTSLTDDLYQIRGDITFSLDYKHCHILKEAQRRLVERIRGWHPRKEIVPKWPVQIITEVLIVIAEGCDESVGKLIPSESMKEDCKFDFIWNNHPKNVLHRYDRHIQGYCTNQSHTNLGCSTRSWNYTSNDSSIHGWICGTGSFSILRAIIIIIIYRDLFPPEWLRINRSLYTEDSSSIHRDTIFPFRIFYNLWLVPPPLHRDSNVRCRMRWQWLRWMCSTGTLWTINRFPTNRMNSRNFLERYLSPPLLSRPFAHLLSRGHMMPVRWYTQGRMCSGF